MQQAKQNVSSHSRIVLGPIRETAYPSARVRLDRGSVGTGVREKRERRLEHDEGEIQSSCTEWVMRDLESLLVSL